jgi:hypothetical protein
VGVSVPPWRWRRQKAPYPVAQLWPVERLATQLDDVLGVLGDDERDRRDAERGREREQLRDGQLALAAFDTADRRLLIVEAEFCRARFPELPSDLNDRACDSWEPLIAIADAAGDEWPHLARAAAKHLTGSDEEMDDLGVQLLTDLQHVWPTDDVATGNKLTEKLKDDDDDGLWRNYGRQGKGLTAKSMATILRPFGIHPDQHWVGGTKIRGYARADFEKAWGAYVADSAISGVQTGRTGRTLMDKGESPPTEPVGDDTVLPLRSDPDPLQDNGPTGPTTSDAENDGNGTLTPRSEDDDGRDYEVF